jgi:hypothetical protein
MKIHNTFYGTRTLLHEMSVEFRVTKANANEKFVHRTSITSFQNMLFPDWQPQFDLTRHCSWEAHEHVLQKKYFH